MKVKYALFYTLFLMSVFHTSCGQHPTNPPTDNSKSEAKDIAASLVSNDPSKPTRYEYTDAVGKRLVVQNSFPKGGIKYKDLDGKEYVGVVFWTRITNETDDPVNLQIDFSGDSYELPSSAGSSRSHTFEIMLHPDTMTRDKEALVNYGLTDLDSFLNNSIHKPSSLKRTINPKQSNGFYVVRLAVITKLGLQSGKGDGNGTTRAGLSLKGQNLVYTLNGKEIDCGSINLKDLKLRK